MGHQIKSDLGSSSLASHMVIFFCINEKLIIPARRRLKCYTARSGDKYQFCSTKEGLQTCFTKFEMGEARLWRWCESEGCDAGEVVGRGCSTKRPLYHVECEDHDSGPGRQELYCYCSFPLCNPAPVSAGAAWLTPTTMTVVIIQFYTSINKLLHKCIFL